MLFFSVLKAEDFKSNLHISCAKTWSYPRGWGRRASVELRKAGSVQGRPRCRWEENIKYICNFPQHECTKFPLASF